MTVGEDPVDVRLAVADVLRVRPLPGGGVDELPRRRPVAQVLGVGEGRIPAAAAPEQPQLVALHHRVGVREAERARHVGNGVDRAPLVDRVRVLGNPVAHEGGDPGRRQVVPGMRGEEHHQAPVAQEDERGVVVVVAAEAAEQQMLGELAALRQPRDPDVAGRRDPAREGVPVVRDGPRVAEIRPCARSEFPTCHAAASWWVPGSIDARCRGATAGCRRGRRGRHRSLVASPRGHGSARRRLAGGGRRGHRALLALAFVFAVPGSPLRDDDSPAPAPSRRRRLTPRPRSGARALAAARGLGLQPLAALRRGSPARAAGVTRGEIWRQLRDDRHNLAELAAAHGWPDPASSRRRSSLRGPPTSPPRCSRPCAAARSARSRRATSPSICSSIRCTSSRSQRRARDLRRHRRGVSPAAPRRAEPAGDRAPARPLAVADPGARRRRPARARALRHHDGRDERAPGPDPPAPPAQPASALARAGALQRPAADARRQAHRQAARLRRQPGAVGRRRAGGLRVLPAEASARAAARRDQRAVGRGRRRPRRGARNASFNRARRTPRSAYNPTVSDDGRLVAFESAEGNLNFAKRYGQIGVFVNDARSGRTIAMPQPPQRPGVSRSEYNPVISGDGRRVAYQAQRRTGRARSTSPICATAARLASRGRARRRAPTTASTTRRSPATGRASRSRRRHRTRRGRPARAHPGVRPRPGGGEDDARQPRERRPQGDRRRDGPTRDLRDGRYVASHRPPATSRGRGGRAARASTSATRGRVARPP